MNQIRPASGKHFRESVRGERALATKAVPTQRKARWELTRNHDGFIARVPYKLANERAALKAPGFTWHAKTGSWRTEDIRIAAKFRSNAKGALREELRPYDTEGAQLRVLKATSTRLRNGDVEAMRAIVRSETGPQFVAFLRLALDCLTEADEDRATVWNQSGFGKADSELGHALHLRGVRKVPDAAIASKLAWRYRRQLPVEVVSVLFPTH